MKARFAFWLALSVLATIALPAQNKRMGTSGATELLIPVGARDIAMGGSTMATSRGAEAIFWNPAGLGLIGYSAEGLFSTMTYIADISVQYGAIAASFQDFGVIGFSIKSLDFGDIPLTTNDDPEGRSGRMFSPTFVSVGLTYARSLTDAITAGGTFRIITEDMERVFASGVALDVGVQYRNLGGLPGFHFGVAVKNIGPQMRFDGPGLLGPARRSDGERPEQKYEIQAGAFELPSVFDVGVAYESAMADNMNLNVNGSYTNKNLGLDEFRIGGEIGFNFESVRLYGRLGTGLIPQAVEDEERIFGTALGVGILYKAEGLDLTVDYAYRSVQFFEANSVLSLKFGF